MIVFQDKAYEDFVAKLNDNESIVDFMAKMGCDTTVHQKTFYKCVFHEDKTPSLSINDKKGVFHCFSCNRAGKYFDFVYQYHKTNLGFKKSQKELAKELILKDKTLRKKYGIESLEKKVEFSEKTIKYMLETQHLMNRNKKLVLKDILDNSSSTELSKKLQLEKRIRETDDLDELMILFSDIQKGKIEIN